MTGTDAPTERPEQHAPEAASTAKWPVIVWALYIGGFISFGATMLAGAIVAYVKRPELAGTPAYSHMTYAIRTFWVTVAVALFGFAAPFELSGVVFLPLMLWHLLRIVRGFLRAVDGRPIDKPNGPF